MGYIKTVTLSEMIKDLQSQEREHGDKGVLSIEISSGVDSTYGFRLEGENDDIKIEVKAFRDRTNKSYKLPSLGDKILILKGGHGARGCDGCKAIVIEGDCANSGLLNSDKGFCVKIIDNKSAVHTNSVEIGNTWKIGYHGEYKFLD